LIEKNGSFHYIDWGTFIDDLDLFLSSFREPVIAMGHSRGAVVSMLLALRRPDLVRALILIDPTILPFSAMWLVHLAKQTGLNRSIKPRNDFILP